MITFVCLVLLGIESQSKSLLMPLKSSVMMFLTPVQKVANIPYNIKQTFSDSALTSEQKTQKITSLETENVLLKGKLQQMVAVMAENSHLKSLLNAKQVLGSSVLIAEIHAISSDPFKHELFIDRGLADGIKTGQSVIDDYGLIGQITEVYLNTAKVLLISDRVHATPVFVHRNSVRAIVVGVGSYDELLLANIPNTTDVQVGDILLSSGLGKRFPVGYPVATISEVIKQPNLPFAVVKASPKAKLDAGRFVLVVSSVDQEQKIQQAFEQTTEELQEGVEVVQPETND